MTVSLSAQLFEIQKRCTKCGETKVQSDFNLRRGFLTSWCKACKVADQKAREARDPEKHAAAKRAAATKHYRNHKEKRRLYAKKARVKYLYGVSYETAAAMLAMQNDACGICEKRLTLDDTAKKREWHVDHDHDSGKIRGILCGNCNTALGLVKESLKTLANAMRYLKSHGVK